MKHIVHQPAKRKSFLSLDYHQISTLALITLLFLEILLLRNNPTIISAMPVAIVNAGLVFFFLWRAIKHRS